MEEKTIINLYLSRDEKAISLTQEKYGSRIREVIYDLIKDYSYVEDCENDCYLNTWKSIPPNKPYGYFFSYIVCIARNIALNFIRDKMPKRLTKIVEISNELEDTIPCSETVDDFLDSYALKEILNQYLDSLPDEKRNIFIRRYWYLDSVKEIAKGYSITIGKVKTILFRCRNELKDILIKEGYEL